jgi:hypothetical protein
MDKWFSRLGLFDDDDTLIGVRKAYVVDWNECTVHGMKFRHGELAYTLATVKKDEVMGKIASRMESYIILAGISASTATRLLAPEEGLF